MVKNSPSARKTAIGLWTIFLTQFVSYVFINARNIALPGIVADLYGRRAILLITMTIFGIGLALSTFSTSMAFLVAAATFMSIGHYPIIPLCFSVIGFS